jgi:protein transport protein SEC24
MSGRRLDFDQRPELSRGTVDFRVSEEYWAVDPSNPEVPEPKARTPEPLSYIFAIDVSWTSAKGGVAKEVAQGLKEVLFGHEAEDGERIGGLPSKAKVAILTFDRTVHFYNLQVSCSSCAQGEDRAI